MSPQDLIENAAKSTWGNLKAWATERGITDSSPVIVLSPNGHMLSPTEFTAASRGDETALIISLQPTDERVRS